jgi:phosphoribosylaminoimidazole carboxylase
VAPRLFYAMQNYFRALDACTVCALPLTHTGSILLNEVAPRVHNSGHFTIEGSYTSQFEQHLRCITGLPLGSTAMRVPAAAMLNLLGEGDLPSDSVALRALFAKALATPGASGHWYGKPVVRKGRKMGHVTITGDSARDVLASLQGLYAVPPRYTTLTPLVGVIMGSDSDLPTLAPCFAILKEFGVPFEVTIVSAHRTPKRLVEYATSARLRGLHVIIAAAGGAAHLPGMVAAMTPLPVIGVPVPLKHLDGVDSLHSMVQMPRGVPVAVVAIGNSTNAALLAVRILGSHVSTWADALEAYAAAQERDVLGKAALMETRGWEALMPAGSSKGASGH